MHSTSTVWTFHKPRGRKDNTDSIINDSNGKQRTQMEANVVASMSLYIFECSLYLLNRWYRLRTRHHHETYCSGSSVSFFFFSNWSLLIDLQRGNKNVCQKSNIVNHSASKGSSMVNARRKCIHWKRLPELTILKNWSTCKPQHLNNKTYSQYWANTQLH